MAVQLGHKALAETHDLGIRLAVGVKVSAAFAAAHGQAGQAVLEALLKAQELQDRQVDRGMETQAAFVGTDGRVELHTVTAVDLNLALVIDPGHTEHDDALGLDKALDQAGLLVLGVGSHNGLQALEDFLNSLQEFFLFGVTLCQVVIDALEIRIGKCHSGNTPLYNSFTEFIVSPCA